jgi:hypothetical protein
VLWPPAAATSWLVGYSVYEKKLGAVLVAGEYGVKLPLPSMEGSSAATAAAQGDDRRLHVDRLHSSQSVLSVAKAGQVVS